MKQKKLYSVRGSIFFGNKLFVAETSEEAVQMYNSLVVARNKRFNENNPLSSTNDVFFKGFAYVP